MSLFLKIPTLMLNLQVYLPAIREHVPPQMVHCMAAFLEFCYLVRRDRVTESSFAKIKKALARFHKECVIFKESGVRLNFNLPRQHSLEHYLKTIKLFGSPNGLCSSITESKHIKAVKEPWHRSSHFEALGQMLIINQCIDKLSASRVDFISRGLLLEALVLHPNIEPEPSDPDAVPMAGPRV